MKYSELLNNNKIIEHCTSEEEIAELLAVARRDLQDAQLLGLSDDRAYATAYNAALQLCTVIMAKCGYRTRGSGHHKTSFDFVELSENGEFYKYAVFFNICRRKRNDVDYDRVSVVSQKERTEIINTVKEFFLLIEKWLKK